MDDKELQRILEAVLFASGEPVSLERLCFTVERDPEEVETALRRLADLYAYERRGIRIVRLEDSWQMCSQSDLAGYVTRALETRKPPKLSGAQLETLTIIAYYQPTTKTFIESLRGVDSSYSVQALLNKKLICEDGRLNVPGRPILYRTTPDFLRTFCLESLEELPQIEKLDLRVPEQSGESAGEPAPSREEAPSSGPVPVLAGGEEG